MDDGLTLHDHELELAGVDGELIEIPSANPTNYHQAITATAECDPQAVFARLFVTSAGAPLVMVVPGSLGVGANHVAHAETLIAEGFSVLLVDPFGARAVTSTVANQAQYSFAASAFDVAAALRTVVEDDRIDPTRISAQGHSRGGSAVMTAAMRPFADAVVGPDGAFAGVYAVYPWCGHQFRAPHVGDTVVRAIIGELDEWVSVQQVQAQTHAIELAGGTATAKIVAAAHHSFDRLEPVHELPDAAVAPAAPVVYLADDGAMIDPLTGTVDPDRTDYDGYMAAFEGGFARQGARIGGIDDQPARFRDDMLAFHTSL